MFNSQCAILSRSECRIAVGKGIGGGVLLAALLAANPFACSRPAIRAGEVRGRGLLLALELKGAVSSQIVEAALRRGLLVNAPRPTAIRFMP